MDEVNAMKSVYRHPVHGRVTIAQRYEGFVMIEEVMTKTSEPSADAHIVVHPRKWSCQESELQPEHVVQLQVVSDRVDINALGFVQLSRMLEGKIPRSSLRTIKERQRKCPNGRYVDFENFVNINRDLFGDDSKELVDYLRKTLTFNQCDASTTTAG
jgi:hypothetical protein